MSNIRIFVELDGRQMGVFETRIEDFASLEPFDLAKVERRVMVRALRVTRGNREKAALMLGIGERSVYRKIKLYGITKKDWS